VTCHLTGVIGLADRHGASLEPLDLFADEYDLLLAPSQHVIDIAIFVHGRCDLECNSQAGRNISVAY
jgi:hypothetical protein